MSSYRDGVLIRGTPAFGSGSNPFGGAGGLSGGVYQINQSETMDFVGSPWSVEFWAKFSGTGTHIALGTDTGGGPWFGASNGYCCVNLIGIGQFGGGSAIGESGTPILADDGAWHWVGFYCDLNYVYAFVDGVPATKTNEGAVASLSWSSGVLAIGGYGGTGSYDWPGSIFDLRISRACLHTTSSYTRPSAPLADPSGYAVAHYPLVASGNDTSSGASSGGVYPLASQVEAGVVFGPSDNLTGTYSGSGGFLRVGQSGGFSS